MVLGQVLERLGDETFAAETMVALDDLNLMIQVEAAGQPFGEGVGEYAAGASRRFAQLASDEDWLALMTALERADDAGTACLKHMLAWSLRHDAAHWDDGTDDRAEGGCGGHCTCTRS